MKKNISAETRRSFLLGFIVLTLLAAIIVLPSQFRSTANNEKKAVSNTFLKLDNLPDGIEDYDIRNHKMGETLDVLLNFRQSSNVDAATIADVRDRFVRGENALKTSVPTLKIEYNKELENPEVIAPDVLQGRAFLTAPSNAKRAETLHSFAKENNDLLALTDDQISRLKVTADYTNPNGELSFARMEQLIDGIPVFRAEIRAGFNKQGAMFRVVNNLAPALEYERLSKEFGDPAEAVRRAAGFINHELKPTEFTFNKTASTDLKAVFGEGDWATAAEKMYFPIEAGVARAAWRVLIWEPVNAYYVIVDAETGTLLYRENITKDQTQAATFNVYANPTSMIKSMANPAPLSPNPISPSLGTQGVLMPRSNVTIIGNEAPYTFNNNGWITDGGNTTDGNAVEAGVDRVTPNGVDAPVVGTNRVFNFDYTPGAGANNGPGESPLLPVYQNGAGTNLFYVCNRYHDETYLLGFTEQARNFQQDNFGRGGLGADRVSAEAQDSSGTNNANFATPADGTRGRMQMYLWNLMTPNRDGDLDAEIIVHEFTHGLFGRLHNGNGGTQAGQMNEGNSDFFGHVMLSNLNDPIEGVYVTGAYSTLNLRPAAPFSSVGNYYYGIRRFPKAVLSFTGGPDNRPHNPLTYADIDPAQMNLSNGAFAPAFAGSATAVHDGGEIWSSMLWEVRARLVTRLGAVAGNKKVLQLVMDGMKVSPSNPTMLQERNAILSAALANGNGGDVADIWAGFAVRGLGFTAANPTGNTVVENFDLPNATLTNPFSVSDAPGDNDGFPEPGENVLLNISINNTTGNPVNNVQVSVAGGGSANFGTIANGATVTNPVSYTVPASAVCGGLHQVSISVSSEIGSQTPQTREFRLGVPVGGTAEFTDTTARTIPTTVGTATPYVTSINVSGLSGNKIMKVELTGLTHTNPTDLDFLLVGPGGQTFVMMSDMGSTPDVTNANVTLTDTATVTIPTTLVTGTYRPGNVGATDTFAAPAPAAPYNHPATAGTATFVSVYGADGANMNGEWKLYLTDDLTGNGGSLAGWKLIFDSNDFLCSLAPSNKARADFDGDGKTDLSVFRQGEGNWYLNRSAAGFTALNWGLGTDTLVPGDYDGDGKTDVAVFRNGNWFINKSTGGSQYASFGTATDKPVVSDYDGDGKADVAVFRPSNGTWYVQNSGGGISTIVFGQNGDIPVAGDYDNDGKTNVAVFRPSTGFWYVARANGVPAQNFDALQFGTPGDKLVPADYDGDGKTDIAVFRPSNGTWYLQRSQSGATAIQFGISTDVPVPGDYDGDGKTDVAVYRGGAWYVNRTTAGLLTAAFGINADAPIPKQYIP